MHTAFPFSLSKLLIHRFRHLKIAVQSRNLAGSACDLAEELDELFPKSLISTGSGLKTDSTDLIDPFGISPSCSSSSTSSRPVHTNQHSPLACSRGQRTNRQMTLHLSLPAILAILGRYRRQNDVAQRVQEEIGQIRISF